METFKERNYKKEYENYHSKPEQKKRRAGRNHARRQLKDTKGIVGKDVHHKDGNPMNNDKSNLSIVTQKYNRTEPRLRDEEREPQDKDIKDKKGTQPAKYFKGLKKTTKSKRDAHFQRGKEKSDSDPSAYKDAPGDKKARKEPMRKSKYTKDYQKMYGEVLAYEARAFHDFGANSPAANNKIRDIANKAKDFKDAMNKIVNFAKGSSTPSKKFAQAVGAGKYTDFEPDKDISQNIKDFIQQRDRVKKLGPRANDPDQNLQVQLKGAEDLRTGSDIKLDDGKTIKVTQKNAKIINMALDRVKPQMRVQLIKLLGKNKQSFMKALGAIKRSMA
jgi:hypothetical protein|tara:strand:- start:5138 stop:6130 length:993 start_codon:yes stop_codon:yes gene_type:complete